MLRCLSYFLSLALLAFSAVSCFENDLPYPYVRASITGLEAEGVISCEIDEPRNTITLHLDETTDIKRVNITGVTYGQKETWPEKEIRGVDPSANLESSVCCGFFPICGRACE